MIGRRAAPYKTALLYSVVDLIRKACVFKYCDFYLGGKLEDVDVSRETTD